MRRAPLVVGLVLLVIGVALWRWAQPPAGVETMGGEDVTLAWIGLVTAAIGLISSLVSLIATFRK